MSDFRAPCNVSRGTSVAAWPQHVSIVVKDVLMSQQCTHLDQIHDVMPNTPEGCEECLANGDTWVHLRLCLTCGHVGCCDSSKNKHASKHAHTTGHPIVQSFQPGEDWRWCYVDLTYV
jgi:uncharacterized UBP type Zn finger protein